MPTVGPEGTVTAWLTGVVFSERHMVMLVAGLVSFGDRFNLS